MSKTKYPCVFKNDKTGFYYYSVELGVDRITGKRIQKKSSKSKSVSYSQRSLRGSYQNQIRIS